MRARHMMGLAIGIAAIAGCATMLSDGDAAKKALAMMKHSFKENGQAKLDRLDQDEVQATCSLYATHDQVPKDVAERIEKSQLASVKYPADGTLLGDWKAGEAIAQSGVGKQFTDDPSKPNGANCYACHQLAPQEVAFGTIGPSLTGYGKLRGTRQGFTAELRQAVDGLFQQVRRGVGRLVPRLVDGGVLQAVVR